MEYPYNKKVLLAGICISGLFLIIGTTAGDINLIRMIFIAVGLSLLFCSIKYQNSRGFGSGLLSLVGAFCYLVGISLGIRGVWSVLTQFQKMEWLAMLATTIFFIMSGYFSFKAVASIRKSGDKSIKPHIEKDGFKKDSLLWKISKMSAEDNIPIILCIGAVVTLLFGVAEKEMRLLNLGVIGLSAGIWMIIKNYRRNTKQKIDDQPVISEKDTKGQVFNDQGQGIEKEGMLDSSNFDNLFADLENEDPDVRREASRLLSKGSKNIQMLISIYQNCLDSDTRRAILAGRVLGRMIVKDSNEHAGAGIAQALLGIHVSFIPCNCIHCGYLNRGIPAPPNGPMAGYYHQIDYHQTDEKGVYAIPVLCDSCGKDFFVVWDEDPR